MSEGFGKAIPVFRVVNLQASIDYYVNVLGFKLEWSAGPDFASVSRDRCNVFLCVGDQGNPGVWVWIGVGDAEAVFNEFRGKGARIRNPPANFEWAYELQVEDLDGNVLRLGSEPKPGVPFGPWRDMHGLLWVSKPEGGWTRAEGK